MTAELGTGQIDRRAVGLPPALVGRAREQMYLREELARAMGGRGRLVLIGGDAGIGKTSLVRDLAADSAERGLTVLAGHCYDLTNTPPYGPWLDLFERYQPKPEQPPAPARLAGGRLDRVDDRAALFADVRRFLGELVTGRPAVVILEDLHWVDPASLELLRSVAAHVGRWPVLVLVTYREDELDTRHPLHQQLPAIIHEGDAFRLDLRPLDRAGLRALVAEQVRLGPADVERLADYLAVHAEGNPFFATELMRALEGEALVRDHGGGWSLGRLDRVVLPTLLRQVIDVRVARLGETTRQALAIAAVIGQNVPLAIWGRLARLDEDALLAIVEAGVEAHLLEADRGGASVHFVHAVTREALYEAILPPRRRLLNQGVAEALLEEPDPDPDEVAFHLEEAGDERASDWLVRAADRAHATHAWLTAADRLHRAAVLLEAIPGKSGTHRMLLFRIGYMLRFADPTGSLAAFEGAAELARRDGDDVLVTEAAYIHGFVMCYSDRFRAGLAEMAGAIESLKSIPRAVARGLAGLSLWNPRWGRAGDHAGLDRLSAAGFSLYDLSYTVHLAAAGYSLEAMSVAEPSVALLTKPTGTVEGITSDAAFGLHGLGISYAASGRPAEATTAWDRARQVFAAVDHFMLIVFTLLHEARDLAMTYGAADPAGRRALAAEAEAMLGRAGGALRPGMSPRLAWLGSLVLDGRWDEADEILRDLPPTGNAYLRREVTAAVVTLAQQRGQPAAAWAEIDAVLADGAATEPGDDIHQEALFLQRSAAELCLAAGDLATASAWLEAHDRWLAWNGSLLGQAHGRLAWARWHRAAGELAAARAAADEAVGLAADPPQPLVLLATNRLLGEMATGAGDPETADAHLATALDLAAACEVPFEQALTLLALAELRLATASPDVARPLIDEVREVGEALRAYPLLRRVDALDARPGAASPAPAGLTPRELEVLRLLSRRMTNPEIADSLFVGQRTVQTHVEHIFGKLGVANRREAADVAIQLGIV